MGLIDPTNRIDGFSWDGDLGIKPPFSHCPKGFHVLCVLEVQLSTLQDQYLAKSLLYSLFQYLFRYLTNTASMRSLLALPILFLSSFTLATPLNERQANTCLQCNPLPTPGDNSQQCGETTICVTQPGGNYCACRGGYRGSGPYPPGDTSVQVSLASVILQVAVGEWIY